MNSFYKYSATGNDFVVLDNRERQHDPSRKEYWARVCDRHFGVGADGILFLESSKDHDYLMRYLNADGGEVSMCGNGARALCHFYQTKIAKQKGPVSFETVGGIYRGEVETDGRVSVVMSELYDEAKFDIADLMKEALSSYYANTGVPHCVFQVENTQKVPLGEIGPRVRYDPRFKEGTNVNFYELLSNDHLKVRTYERGVEGETLSCGTGIVATVVAELRRQQRKTGAIKVTSNGGEVEVEVRKSQIIYRGQVLAAFKGELLF